MKGIKVIKVINVGSNPEEEEVEFRIRGLCLSHVIRDNPYMDLEFQDGKKVRENNFELLIPKGRMRFFDEEMKQRNSPNFQSIYVCNGVLNKQIEFTELLQE